MGYLHNKLARFLLIAMIASPLAAGGDAPNTLPLTIKVGDFCGIWKVILPNSPPEIPVPLANCTEHRIADTTGYFGNCTTRLAPGIYQLHIRAAKDQLKFELTPDGNVTVLPPHAGLIANGGPDTISLSWVELIPMPNADRGALYLLDITRSISIEECEKYKRLTIPFDGQGWVLYPPMGQLTE